MKVLPVSTATPNTFWTYQHAVHFEAAVLPAAGPLLTLAAMLPKNWELKLVDLNIASLTDAQFAWADLRGIARAITSA